MTALPKLPLVITKPRLSARSAAKFMHLGMLDQARLLHDQKFPKQVPQIYKQPYYAPPIAGIRGYFDSGAPAIADARGQIQRLKIASRRQHCHRVIDNFLASDHAQRALKPMVLRRVNAEMGDLELRLSPDLWALEGDEQRIIYFNANSSPQDGEQAKKTLDIAHWVLEQNEIDIKPEQIEFIDLSTGVLHKLKNRRSRTIKMLEEYSKIIASLWPTIDP